MRSSPRSRSIRFRSRAALALAVLLPLAGCGAPDASESLVSRAQTFRELIEQERYDEARAMMADDPRRWFAPVEGEGQPWTLGANAGPWSGWDEHFGSESEVVSWSEGPGSATVVVRETNDYYRLLERGSVTNEITYLFDDEARLGGLVIGTTGERPPGRTEEFLAWAREHAATELEALMPGGEIDPSGDHPERFRALLERWRAAVGGDRPSPGADAAVASRAAPPDIVLVLVDDLRWDELGVTGHPYVETPNIDRLAAEGALFTHAFHAVPLCSPNRASLLTGQYPSRHGVIDNVARDLLSHRLRTFPQALQTAGYETAFIGKWHMGNDPTPRPGFDTWVGLPGQGRILDPVLHVDGRLQTVEGYVTDVLTDEALSFVERPRERPFFLFLSHKAIHPDARQLDDGSVDLDYPMVYVPAERHAGRYEGEVFPRRPNVPESLDDLESAASRSALEERAGARVAEEFGEDFLDPLTSEETIRRRAEMLLSVDEGLGRIIEALEARGTLDRTVIVFTSDNGYFFGEHGFSIERRMPYDESIRSPLLVRYPPDVAAGRRIDEFALSIDLAPTLLELGRAEIGEHIQGRSLVPLLEGEAGGAGGDWRTSILVEFYTYENPMPWLVDMDYRAVRTDRWKYIHWTHHGPELYDVVADPYETDNLVGEPGMVRVADELRRELARLSLEALSLSVDGAGGG